MKYTIEVKKLSHAVVEVEAANKTEAARIARKEAGSDDALWCEPHLRTRLVHSKRKQAKPDDRN